MQSHVERMMCVRPVFLGSLPVQTLSILLPLQRRGPAMLCKRGVKATTILEDSVMVMEGTFCVLICQQVCILRRSQCSVSVWKLFGGDKFVLDLGVVSKRLIELFRLRVFSINFSNIEVFEH